MYLADTNIFLEILLNQDKAAEARAFLQSIDLGTIFMTDFSLHSIGIALFQQEEYALFISFLEDTVVDGVGVLSLDPEDHKTLDQIAQQFNLDFDDAYQYAVAEKHNLQLISFDGDFDQTARGRKEPTEILK